MRVLGLDVEKQGPIRNAGHSNDRLVAVDPKSGTGRTIYFNVDIPTGWLNRKLR